MRYRFIGKATPIVHSLWDRDVGVRASRNYYSSSILQGRSCKDCGGYLCAICNVRYPSRTGIQRLRREGTFDRTVQDGFIGLAAPARLSVARPFSQSVQKGCAGVVKFPEAQSLKAITCVERTKASWPARGYVVPYESYCLSVILPIGRQGQEGAVPQAVPYGPPMAHACAARRLLPRTRTGQGMPRS